MLLYLCFFNLFLCFVWEKRNCLKGVCSQKSLLMYTLAIYLCFVLLFHWIYFILPMHLPFINFVWGFALCLYIFLFLIFIDYFKIFSINSLKFNLLCVCK